MYVLLLARGGGGRARNLDDGPGNCQLGEGVRLLGDDDAAEREGGRSSAIVDVYCCCCCRVIVVAGAWPMWPTEERAVRSGERKEGFGA